MMTTKSKEEEVTMDNLNLGNFEQEYIEGCKKLNIKPLSILRIGHIPPPLPLKVTDVETIVTPTRAQSGGRKKSTTLEGINAVMENPSNTKGISSIPTRKVVNDRRELSIQEFLKKGQIDFESSGNIVSDSVNTPYQSRFKYTPTICLESLEGDDGDEETIYKVQLRAFKLDVGTFMVLNSIAPAFPNLVQIKFFYLK
jgi:hypothetical protein